MTSAAPTLVFVHGGLRDAGDWSEVVRHLAPSFPLVAENLPGHGGTALPREYTLRALAHAVRATLARVGAAMLIAHSAGVAVALEAVRSGSTRIAGLVLIEGGVGRHADPDRSLAAVTSMIETLGIRAFLSRLAESWCPDPREQVRVRQALDHIDPNFAHQMLLDAVRWEQNCAETALRSLSCPVLAVQSTVATRSGRRSLRAGESTAWLEFIRATVPHSRSCTLVGRGHFPHVEDGATIADLIGRFARECAIR